MTRRLLLLASLLVFLAPVVAAQDDPDSLRLQVDADEMVFQVLEPVTGADAAEIRTEIDQEFGDDDGTVEANEIQAYQDDSRVTFSQDQPECFDDFDLLRIDGQPPRRMSEVREEIIGALNTKASSTAPLQEVQILHFLYPKPSSDQVTVTLMMNDWSGVSNAATCTVGATFSYTAPRGYPDYDAAWTAAGPTTADGAWNGDWDWSDYYPAGSAQSTSDTIFRIHPWGQAKILRDTIRPESARNLWDNQGLRADTDQEAAVLFGNRITFTAQGGGDSETNFVGTARDVGAIIGYTTVGVASAAGIAVLATEFARYKFFKLLFLIPGFSRLEKDEVLEHNKRDELYRFIKTTPGPSFSDLRRELGLSNGTLVHHLRILEAQEYVKPVRDGFRTRFYVRGPKIVPTSYLTRTQIQLLDAIGANPGLTQKELSLVLGLPRESVSYHTKQLAQKGKLEIKQDGKWRRYWPSPAAPTPAGPSA